jgi:hypothetical protein
LSYSGNLLVENHNGLIVDAEVFQANGTAERDAALGSGKASDDRLSYCVAIYGTSPSPFVSWP